jgi:hypothetical protein
VIDPGLDYSTFLGGAGSDFGEGIAVRDGRAYVTGTTTSANFPSTPGAFDRRLNGDQDAFVTKLKASGSALVYSTFVGGGDFERGSDIAVDRTGMAYVTGRTGSANFPTTPGAVDTTYNGGEDPFVTKLNASGSALAYSTYLSGDSLATGGSDSGEGIAVREGRAYVTGITNSANFPTTPGAFDTTFNGSVGDDDAFVTKLNASGSALDYSTFLGGAKFGGGSDIAVDVMGRAYVTGGTASADYPTTSGAFDTTFNGSVFDDRDVFVTKLNASGSALNYSTFLGGMNSEGR